MSRLQHEPSEKTRELVTALVVAGVQKSRIAAYIGITEKMLRRRYRDTLDLAKERMCAHAANNLLRITSTASGMAAVIAAKYIGAPWLARHEPYRTPNKTDELERLDRLAAACPRLQRRPREILATQARCKGRLGGHPAF